MTAFGRGEAENSHGSYLCEIKSLNSRFIDTNVRILRSMMGLEHEIISSIKKALTRGKIDVTIEVKPAASLDRLANLDQKAASHYLALSSELHSLGAVGALRVQDIIKLDGVLVTQEDNAQDLVQRHRPGVMEALARALSALQEGRAREGAALSAALDDLLGQLCAHVSEMEAGAKAAQKSLYESLAAKLERLLAATSQAGASAREKLGEERFAMEVAILADKSDIEEELTRLKVHAGEFKKLLLADEPVGRQLDFLCQELHREVNTITNKWTQLSAASHSLPLKQVIERLRQQIQNIE